MIDRLIKKRQHRGVLQQYGLNSAILLALVLPYPIFAQDTIKSSTLEAITITTTRREVVRPTVTPMQEIGKEHIESMGAVMVSDVTHDLAGTTLKDYGGIGGVKTVSARGIGSQFTSLAIDGIVVNDARNGQPDLGRYMVGNASYVSFSHGSEQEGLQSARQYAAGSVLNIASSKPVFQYGKKDNLRVGVMGGSFGTVSPSGMWEHKFGNRVKTRAWGSYLHSKGNYPFTQYYTNSRQDSSARLQREHSAVILGTVDGNLFFDMNDSTRIEMQAHYMKSKHELPGPVQYYRQTIGKESTSESVAFLQGRYRRKSGRWESQATWKWQRTYDLYEDSGAMNRQHYAMMEFYQQEYLLGGAVNYRVKEWWTLGVASDVTAMHLKSSLSDNNDVWRGDIVSVGKSRMRIGAMTVNMSVVHNYVGDRIKDADTMPRYSRLSPFMGVNMRVSERSVVRVFYKHTFRVPNFTELYFFTMPRNLQPERARQWNIGWTTNIGEGMVRQSASVDVYHNKVENKIIAVPKQNMFTWSMQNVGKVVINGCDVAYNMSVEGERVGGDVLVTYTYQSALDNTEKGGKTYRNQIVYTPRHSASLTGHLTNRWCNIGTTLDYTGERYWMAQNTEESRLPSYWEVGLIMDRTFNIGEKALKVMVQCMNIFDVQYEVVRSYPMMGRNWRVSITFDC